MAIASPTRHALDEADQYGLLDNISWETYSALLRDLEDRRIFLTYDQGQLEIMSPSFRHEAYGTLIGLMVGILTEELRMPIKTGRSTTFRREELERGLEPDECFWIANEPPLRGRYDYDPQVDPPPDLAIEVEISRRALNRLGIYAALGVPEIWRCDGNRLIIGLRQEDGTYAVVPRSASLPMLPPDQILRFLSLYETMDETSWKIAFRDWVRAEVVPHHGDRAAGG